MPGNYVDSILEIEEVQYEDRAHVGKQQRRLLGRSMKCANLAPVLLVSWSLEKASQRVDN